MDNDHVVEERAFNILVDRALSQRIGPVMIEAVDTPRGKIVKLETPTLKGFVQLFFKASY
ncbi:MAG: hypothetical protein JW884_00775 [Deltaproteobacteria bacterium]|nr:hypothetical protein [Deltaproteobacteria bacterium]